MILRQSMRQTQTQTDRQRKRDRQIEPYQGKDPWSKGVHSSSPLTVGNCPLCTDDRLNHQGVDDGKEQHTGLQGSQHVGQPCLCRQLVSAHNEVMPSQDETVYVQAWPVYVQAWQCNNRTGGHACTQQMEAACVVSLSLHTMK